MRRTAAWVVIALVAWAGIAQAEVAVGPYFSYAETVGGDGATGGGIKGMWLFHPNFGIELRGSYVQEDEEESDSSVTPAELGAVALYTSGQVDLYAVLGGGYYMFDIDMYGDLEPDDLFGFYAAAGLRLHAGYRAAVFLEFKYTNASDEAESWSRQDFPWGYRITTYTVEYGLEGAGANIGLLLKF